MQDALSATILLVCSTLFFVALIVTAPIAPGQVVAAIFPPWLNKTEVLGIVAAAGGHMLRHGGVESVALVKLETPEDAQRLKRVGAWAVIASDSLFGCIGVSDAARRLTQKETLE